MISAKFNKNKLSNTSSKESRGSVWESERGVGEVQGSPDQS
jgi:hypothetical protein